MIIQGDMLQAIDAVDDNSVDLLLTDPPYNISDRGAKPEWFKTNEAGERVNVNHIHSQKFDESFEDNWDSQDNNDFKQSMNDWATAWFPKVRPGGTFCIFISDVYVSHLWESLEAAGFEPKRMFSWKKPAAVPFNRRVNPVSGCEYVLFGIKPKGKRTFNADASVGTIVERYSLADKVSSIVYKYVKDDVEGNLDRCFSQALADAKKMYSKLKRTDDVVHCVVPNTITYSGGLGKNKIHPTQKPEEILEYFISLCSNPGDTVMDTFAGSGSTGVVAQRLDRQFILIEQDPQMFEKMNQRFVETQFDTLFN
mgnify:FL=1